MPVRPVSNAPFYTASESRCRQWVDELADCPVALEAAATPVAGIVPHAGWHYSGGVAGRVWRALRETTRPETIIIFGTVHYPGVADNAAYPDGSWQTPIGPIEVDAELARSLGGALGPLLLLDPEAHDREHSIEVNLPFVKALFPECRILPIAVPPSAAAATLGGRIAELTAGRSIIAVGSTDLTHYGDRYGFAPRGHGPDAYAWMRANDRRMIEIIEGLRAADAVPEAMAHHNACGPGAIAATLGYARAAGAERGQLLEYKTSHDVSRDPVFDLGVGYAGVVF
jgi:hypothetical protein